MPVTWDELAALALARQFPSVEGRDADADADAVARTLRRVGPIQSQTARSPFLTLASRMPGVAFATIRAAYEQFLIVRGSNLRGTVHTSAPDDHILLDAVTRIGQRAFWTRMLRLDSATLEDVWTGIEGYADDEWRTPDELSAHLRAWLLRHDPAARPTLDGPAARYLGFGHGGLIRRPLTGDWHTQGAAGYRAASAVLGDRRAVLCDPGRAADAIVRRHLRAHGPASRHEIAWWSGLGLRTVDAALTRAGNDLTTDDGPDGRRYHDLLEVPGGIAPPVALLPEFDALLSAYDPPGRARFVTPEQHRLLWPQQNGQMRAPLLIDGRITGYWQLAGTTTRRSCEVTCFLGTRRPTPGELDAPIAALGLAYGVTVTGVTIERGG